jgi:hypothetical protein
MSKPWKLRSLIGITVLGLSAWTGLTLSNPIGCRLPTSEDPYYSSYESRARWANLYQDLCSIEPNGTKLHVRLRPFEYDLTFKLGGFSGELGENICGS